MIGIMIDHKLARFQPNIEFAFKFVFDTIGTPYTFINKLSELQPADILFIYSLLEPAKNELIELAQNRIVFSVQAETDLLNPGSLSKKQVQELIKELKLFNITPVITDKNFEHPIITYKTNTYYWGKFNFDIIGNIFFHLSHYEDLIPQPKDQYDRIPDSAQSLFNYSRIPTVNNLLWMIESFLKDIITNFPKAFLIKKEFWPSGEDFAYTISHNVDNLQKWSVPGLMKSIFSDVSLLFTFRWGMLLRLVKEKAMYLFTNFEVYWNFPDVSQILKDFGVKATYFVAAEDSERHDEINYSLDDPDLKEELEAIIANSNEISLLIDHNCIDEKEIALRKNRLERTINKRIKGLRNSRWKTNKFSAKTAGEMDLLYNSNRSMLEQCGFRDGIAFPYRFNQTESNCWEIPIAFSDEVLQMNKFSFISKERAKDSVKTLIQTIQHSNGLLAFNFSFSKFNDVIYDSQLFEYTLGLLRDRKGYNGTMAEIAEWWDSRQKVVIKEREDVILINFPSKVDKITLSLWGNRKIKRVTGAKHTISGNRIILEDIKKEDTVRISAPIDDQIYLEIEQDDEN